MLGCWWFATSAGSYDRLQQPRVLETRWCSTSSATTAPRPRARRPARTTACSSLVCSRHAGVLHHRRQRRLGRGPPAAPSAPLPSPPIPPSPPKASPTPVLCPCPPLRPPRLVPRYRHRRFRRHRRKRHLHPCCAPAPPCTAIHDQQQPGSCIRLRCFESRERTRSPGSVPVTAIHDQQQPGSCIRLRCFESRERTRSPGSVPVTPSGPAQTSARNTGGLITTRATRDGRWPPAAYRRVAQRRLRRVTPAA